MFFHISRRFAEPHYALTELRVDDVRHEVRHGAGRVELAYDGDARRVLVVPSFDGGYWGVGFGKQRVSRVQLARS